jgi:hypothetical protein
MDVDSANDLDEVWTQVNVRASASGASDSGDEASSLVVISRSSLPDPNTMRPLISNIVPRWQSVHRVPRRPTSGGTT